MAAVYEKDWLLVTYSWLCLQHKSQGVFLSTQMYGSSYKHTERWQKSAFQFCSLPPKTSQQNLHANGDLEQLRAEHQASCKTRQCWMGPTSLNLWARLLGHIHPAGGGSNILCSQICSLSFRERNFETKCLKPFLMLGCTEVQWVYQKLGG